MAKQTAKKEQPPKPIIVEKILTKEDKAIKADGRKHTLAEPLKMPGQKEMPTGARIEECNNGYYKIYVGAGNLHYRIGQSLVDKAVTQ